MLLFSKAQMCTVIMTEWKRMKKKCRRLGLRRKPYRKKIIIIIKTGNEIVTLRCMGLVLRRQIKVLRGYIKGRNIIHRIVENDSKVQGRMVIRAW